MPDPNSIDPNNLEQTPPAESQPDAPIDPQPADQVQPDPAPEEATPPTEPTPPQIVPGEEPFVLPSGVTCVMSSRALLHVTVQGDRWDLLAWRYYRDPLAYEQIIDANPDVPIAPVEQVPAVSLDRDVEEIGRAHV